MRKPRIIYDIYIAASMTGYENDAEYQAQRQKILTFIGVLEEKDPELKIFYAGRELLSTTELTLEEDQQAAHVLEDFENISDAKYYLMLYFEPTRSSALVESGWAISMSKNSLYCVKSRADLPYLLQHSDKAFKYVFINEFPSIDELIHKAASGIDIFDDFYANIKKQISVSSISCPHCAKNHMTGEMHTHILPSGKVQYTCTRQECGFSIKSPLLWYEITIDDITHQLEHTGISRRMAKSWAYTLKYTNPSFYISNREEEELSRHDLEVIYDLAGVSPKTDALLINVNTPADLKVIKQKQVKEDHIWITNINAALGKMIQQENHGIHSHSVTVQEMFRNDSPLKEKEGMFDFVYCSKHCDATIIDIVNTMCDALKPGGKAAIKVQKKTAIIYPNGEVEPKNGVYRHDPNLNNQLLTLNYSVNQLQEVVSILRQRKKCINIISYEGSETSASYYVVFERTN